MLALGPFDTTRPSIPPRNAAQVKQSMRGCLQECMGCEAKSEYRVSEMDFDYIMDTGILQELQLQGGFQRGFRANFNYNFQDMLI